jgi:hypothetical protein
MTTLQNKAAGTSEANVGCMACGVGWHLDFFGLPVLFFLYSFIVPVFGLVV